MSLFNAYDLDGSGALDYKEFGQILFGKSSPAKKPGGVGGADPADLVDKLKKKLSSRGARGIIGLGKSFRIMDDNNSRSLDM